MDKGYSQITGRNGTENRIDAGHFRSFLGVLLRYINHKYSLVADGVHEKQFNVSTEYYLIVDNY
jgi:hypothetical protein